MMVRCLHCGQQMSDKELNWHWHLDQYPNFCEILSDETKTLREWKIEKFKANRAECNRQRGGVICP